MPIEFVPRNILVSGVYDFSRRFMPAERFLKRPMVRRGPILIHGDDLDLMEVRDFYLHATPDFDVPLLRLAALNSSHEVIDWVGREYEPTFFDRAEMMQAIRDWYDDNRGCGLWLGVGYGATP